MSCGLGDGEVLAIESGQEHKNGVQDV